MYKLLKMHMDANPQYLFGHAEIAGMLARGDEIMSSYESYKRECQKRCISYYREELYIQFMKDCERLIKLDLHHIKSMG